MSRPISLTAVLRLKPGIDVQKGMTAIAAFCSDMRNEPGCCFAHAMQQNDDPYRFILWEQYHDSEAQQAHFLA
ncbi:putative quinol monooxygenase, partial [Ferrimonas kyonanensis]|uniref:putative quinol monooxygenase n=1 Tax=Ferrimonas kyonanensis TaxID=364763 RepID=UPI0004893991